MNDENKSKAALTKAMALCAAHEYCSSDIRSKLNSWGIGSSEAEQIISELTKEQFLNDTRYAIAFVKDKYIQNKWGRVKIASGLRLKKINEETISRALEQIDEDQYMVMIRDTLNSHRKFIKAKNKYDLKGKLLRFGLSRGFESHLLYDILGGFDL
jgi:regulatory protein